VQHDDEDEVTVIRRRNKDDSGGGTWYQEWIQEHILGLYHTVVHRHTTGMNDPVTFLFFVDFDVGQD
jgi:hypothetical protein